MDLLRLGGGVVGAAHVLELTQVVVRNLWKFAGAKAGTRYTTRYILDNLSK